MPYQNIKGLTDQQVIDARQKYGTNELDYKQENTVWEAIKDLAKEPMVVLLLAAAAIYWASGHTGDAIFMAVSIVLVATISLYQDSRSKKALENLKDYTKARCKVVRNGKTIEIDSTELVVGDSLVIEEGTAVAADGTIIYAHDFLVNESVLTGESLAVEKSKDTDNQQVFQGTIAVSGMAIATVSAIGNQTQLGKIGKSLAGIAEEKTPLEIQISNFVKKMVILGAVVFLLVWGINYWRSQQLLDSLLKSLTLAMSILPEEIPVAFTTFMALGAWRLMKMGIVVKQMKTVETLGSATVICTDKTGTLTENKMSLAKIFTLQTNQISTPADTLQDAEKHLIEIAMWASEPMPFDPMEKALHQSYKTSITTDKRADYEMVHEYPLEGKPPMMTHVFEDKKGNRIIAAKGAPEAIMAVADLTNEQVESIHEAMANLAADGYRILGVGQAHLEGNNFPKKQQDLRFEFKGLVAFNDPPKHNIQKVLNKFYEAGISVKIITGDNLATTTAIAKQVGFKGYDKSITGDELMQLSDTELQRKVADTQVFARMFPEAKLRIINALKANQEIVAMTGDGVNDGPALKAAHIGIAMGKKGTEIAKDAASLILVEDDLAKMVDAVAMGRRIYTNLKKAIQYIISIHIPIILTVFVPLALGWIYPNIFSPVHVIFLELIMGPTCSIIYENEPIEKNAMHQKPRPFTATFFNWKELTTSVIQGLVIALGVLLSYQYAVQEGYAENIVRSMVFTTLISANICLTLVNRSFYYSILTTLRYRNNLVWLIIGITIIITVLLLYVPILANFFDFEPLTPSQVGICVAVGLVSVLWYEIVKWAKRRRYKTKSKTLANLN